MLLIDHFHRYNMSINAKVHLVPAALPHVDVVTILMTRTIATILTSLTILMMLMTFLGETCGCSCVLP